MMKREEYLAQLTGNEIAIIGMSGRFPGAQDVKTFWENLSQGVESLHHLRDEDLLASGISPAEFNHPNYVKLAPTLDHVEYFDAGFFGLSPMEAEVMDPQQRIFMECAWEALENAGYTQGNFNGSIGVYTGARTNTYVFNIVSNPALFKSLGVFQVSIGNDLASLATGVSYRFNLHGPSYALHTACSTSLVAVHLACQSLLIDECQLALAGGVAINVPHRVGYLYDQGGILSPDGHVRAFDADASGTIFGSGAGAVVLKRLEDALDDGDTIYAVIKGSATNNDGSHKATFTAPSVDGQMKVIINALAEAEVSADTITYVEAHATGTSLGDPIEMRALTKAYRTMTERKGYCAIGSVKANVGHLDAAAGVPALIKTILALQHKQLPPSINFRTPNPKLDIENTPFYINTKLQPWQPAGDFPRRAGVSSFGFGGTNAHLILEEAPPLPDPTPAARDWQLLVLSAKTATALDTMTHNLADHCAQHPHLSLADVAYTLQVGRQAFNHRRVLVASNTAEVSQVVAADQLVSGRTELHHRPVVFLFSGQGSQYVQMARGLYEQEPVFQATVDECCELLRPHLNLDLRTLLYPSAEKEEEAAAQLNQTQYTQPALFVVEYALAQLWQAWGVQPEAMMGHSLGEYVAACLAGVFSLAEALQLVALRGRLMQSLPAGAMLLVPLPESELVSLLSADLSLAAVNSPQSCVVSGTAEAITALESRLQAQQLFCRRLHTSHAFHSTMMEPILVEFEQTVSQINLQAPQIPYISNLTGDWVAAAEVTTPHYWSRHLRQTVRFAAGMTTLLSDPARAFLEIGPGTTLGTLARQNGAEAAAATLRHPQDQRDDVAFALTALGRLWIAGVEIDWLRLYPDEARCRVPLPTYPFERQRYWIEPGTITLPATNYGLTPLKKKPEVREWFYEPIWKQTPLPQQTITPDKQRWLIFQDAAGVGKDLSQRLEDADQIVIRVIPGEQFAEIDNHTYAIAPQQSEDYQTLLQNLEANGGLPDKVIHLWSLLPLSDELSAVDAFTQAQEYGYYSLLFLTQGWREKPLEIFVVTDQAQGVNGTEQIAPAQSTILGATLVIPQERLNMNCRSIDIQLLPNRLNEELLAMLWQEINTPANDNQIAYRGNERFSLQFTPITLTEPIDELPRLRQNGVYLITGGLGGIGLLLSDFLAHAVKAKLVLTGRTSLPLRTEWEQWLIEHPIDDPTRIKIERVKQLESAGAEVLLLEADTANLMQMRTVVAQAKARFGTIHGVIHSAGLTREASFHAILKTDRAEVESHFHPKAYGLIVLAQVLEGIDLDFCLLQSSLASILGGLSYIAYAAANMFMDVFARQQRRATTVPWISVNWDSWHHGENAPQGALGATLVELAITPPEGVEAFRHVLSLAQPQIVVSTSNLQDRINQWVKLEALRGPTTDNATQKHTSHDLPTQAELERRIVAIWQRVLGVSTVTLQDNFFDLGGNSLAGMQLISEIKREFNVQIAPVALFEAPTVAALVRYLLPEPSIADQEHRKQRQSPFTIEESSIAIVGLTGRFPGADDLDSFWQNLAAGKESVTFFSDEELLGAGVSASVLADPNYVKASPILNGVEQFDASFFGYSPREAEMMDPQHRLFLECAWHALEDAGYDSERYPGSIGVYAGASISTYLLNLFTNADLLEKIDPLQTAIGNDSDSLTTSVSYKLNLRGPSISVQTFCSTSLVAVHLACQSLNWGECDMALAGGVTVIVPQVGGYHYQAGGILSPDGHSRTFDAAAGGTLFGNGVGIVVLKRLADALADGDTIHAVIKGSAINNDGSLKVGYTAPSVEGQSQVIATAQAAAGVTPDTITYIEAHGTGTALGDPIEIAALSKAFRLGTDQSGYCAIGSLKTNVGHLDRAAGVAALIKTVLALKHRQLPPSLHFETPNPQIDFEHSPFYVNTELRPWENSNGTPRRAGVSALGFGGTNAHVILEEAPPLPLSEPESGWRLLLLSAKTRNALEQATTNLAHYLEQHPEVNLADVAYTLQVGRRSFRHRRVVVGQTVAAAAAALQEPQAALTDEAETRQRPVAFMFPGQGAQYVDMGRGLYDQYPRFREVVDKCCDLVRPALGLDLRTLLFPAPEAAESASQQLQETAITQPALFIMEYALAQLWLDWGVRPQAMIGHSIGEYVAACLAGVFSLADALNLVVRRGQLMHALPKGAMLAVPLSEAEVRPWLNGHLSLAVVNSQERCVVAGSEEAVAGLSQELSRAEIPYQQLHTSHAFHSAMMEPILTEFAQAVAAVERHPPQLPYLSNVTGTWITAAEAMDPAYWAQHLRQTVRFAEGVSQLLAEPERVLLEVGPGQMLSRLARQQAGWLSSQVAISTMRHPQETHSDEAYLLRAVGQLWLAGLTEMDWSVLAGTPRRRISLPAYPFQRTRFWIEANTTKTQARPETYQTDVAKSFYAPSWKRDLGRTPQEDMGHQQWLLFIDDHPISQNLVVQLEGRGQSVALVTCGKNFVALAENKYEINPASQADYFQLLAELRRTKQLPDKVVHLWSLMEHQTEDWDLSGVSLLHLSQALSTYIQSKLVSLWLVTDGVLEVNGEEPLPPVHASIPGMVYGLSQAFPSLLCHQLDVTVLQKQTEKVTEQIMAEVTRSHPDQLVAYRGRYRWLPTIERLSVDKPTSKEPIAETWLVAHGLQDDAYLIMRSLATDKTLLLLEDPHFPQQDQWDDWLSSDTLPSLPEGLLTSEVSDLVLDSEYCTRLKIDEGLQVKENLSGIGLEELSNKLCTSYIVEYLQANGVVIEKGTSYGVESLRRRLKVLTKYGKLYAFMLSVLAEDGLIRQEGGSFTFLHDAAAVEPSTTLQEELKQRFPESRATFEALERCVKQYDRILTGERDAVGVLYPNGSSDMMQAIEASQLRFSNLALCREQLAEILGMFTRQDRSNQLQILEVGAGEGNATWGIIETLKGQAIDYHFTDVTRSFVLSAEQHALDRGIGSMHFDTFDIRHDPITQGLPKYRYDIIIASEVIHATPNVTQAITNLQMLLKPQGLLFVLEASKAQRWATMVWGLLDGWWQFEDEAVRQHSPLLSVAKWIDSLNGFARVETFGYQKEGDYALLVAQQSATLTTTDYQTWEQVRAAVKQQEIRTKIQRIRALEEAAAKVELLSLNSIDETQLKAQLEPPHHAIHGVLYFASPDWDVSMANMDGLAFEPTWQQKMEDLKAVANVLQLTPLNFAYVIFPQPSSGYRVPAQQTWRRIITAQIQANVLAGPWQSISWDKRLADGMATLDCLATLPHMPELLVSPYDLTVEKDARPHISPENNSVSMNGQGADLHPRPTHLLNTYTPPRDETEKAIATIWQDVLGIHEIGIHDNFLDLGGDSLIATQLVSRLRSVLAVNLPLPKFFENPTIAHIAEAVTSIKTEKEDKFALEILSQLDQLSEDEVLAELRKRQEA